MLFSTLGQTSGVSVCKIISGQAYLVFPSFPFDLFPLDSVSKQIRLCLDFAYDPHVFDVTFLSARRPFCSRPCIQWPQQYALIILFQSTAILSPLLVSLLLTTSYHYCMFAYR